MHRAGIVPFELRDGGIAVLLVTSLTRGRWIFPKGQLEPQEDYSSACHREGFEEAGIKGVLIEEFPSTFLINKQSETGPEAVPVVYYPFLVRQQLADWPERTLRRRHWVLIEEASAVVSSADILRIIDSFRALEPWIITAARSRAVEL